MRQVVLDTETTGLEPQAGHRIIELGCVEIRDRKMCNTFHSYFNPERDIDEGAFAVHKITREQLENAPLFITICDDFLEFVRDAELIIHNASFDLAFLDAEFERARGTEFLTESRCKVIDTLEMARDLHPGLKNNLDTLCGRYKVESSAREDAHGALIDAKLLASVYLAMTGGQTALAIDSTFHTDARFDNLSNTIDGFDTPVIFATPEELVEHEKFIKKLQPSELA